MPGRFRFSNARRGPSVPEAVRATRTRGESAGDAERAQSGSAAGAADARAKPESVAKSPV
ncbi:hypothetical protein GCM10009654_26440 [Streptomyces hebeiensis]|uniref:Uncharacterized protein n=1 Tax=Streptomyces hebeiensis TaxID=229486 RepID=A0ABN1UTG3_9ACTN